MFAAKILQIYNNTKVMLGIELEKYGSAPTNLYHLLLRDGTKGSFNLILLNTVSLDSHNRSIST